MNITDKVCDLECVKKGGTVHEFIGPVKIVLVDPPEDEYKRRNSGAAFVVVATMMIGANTVIVYLFFLGFKLPFYINTHIILCTVGFQFCMPLAILMMHSLFGAAAPLKKRQRRIQHVLLHIIGLALAISGSVLAILFGEKSLLFPPEKYSSPHFFSGVVALSLAGMCFLSGPCLYCLYCILGELKVPACFVWVHRFFGILTFIASSVSFVSGIFKPSMLIWLFLLGYKAPIILVVIFTVFYTLVVIVTPMKKLLLKRNKFEQ